MEETIMFRGSAHALEGLLWRPAGNARRGAVICHPHPQRGGDMHNSVVVALTEALQEAGVATLRFNFRGVGDSGGQFDGGVGEADDVRAAIDTLGTQAGAEAITVAGYSFGAMVGLTIGAGDPRVDRLIGVAPPIASRDFRFLERCEKPKLMIAGDQDSFCPLAQLRDLLGRVPEPKHLVVVTGGDHFFRGIESDIFDATHAFAAQPA